MYILNTRQLLSFDEFLGGSGRRRGHYQTKRVTNREVIEGVTLGGTVGAGGWDQVFTAGELVLCLSIVRHLTLEATHAVSLRM